MAHDPGHVETCPDVNYLAHACLADAKDAWVLGAFLGDHVRGANWRQYESEVGEGILLHRRLDSWLDHTPEWIELRATFEPPYRRYAGIMLDLAFDHVLARDWSNYRSDNLTRFSSYCIGLLQQHNSILPSSLRRFSVFAAARGIPGSYRDPDMVRRALAGIGGRLRHANPLADCWPEIEQRLPAIEAAFETLWPQMQATAQQQASRLEAADQGHAAT